MSTKNVMKARLFFPHFTVALLRPKPGTDPNRLQFKISREMSKLDLKLYLKALYGIDVHFVRTIIPKDLTYGEYKSYNKVEYKLALTTISEPFKFPHVDHFFTEHIKKQLQLPHVEQPEEITHSNGPVIAKRERSDQHAPLKLKYDYPTYKIVDPNQAKKSSDWLSAILSMSFVRKDVQQTNSNTINNPNATIIKQDQSNEKINTIVDDEITTTHVGYLPNSSLNFEKEIRQIMSAYDDSNQYQYNGSTIQILDDILSGFVRDTTRRAEQVGKRGKITTSDIIYVVKNDKIKYYRAKELLKLNEQLKKAKKLAEADVDLDLDL